MRGIGDGYAPTGDNRRGKVTLREHVADLTTLCEHAPGREYVVIAHSFASLPTMSVISDLDTVIGGAFLCGVPPSGNGPMTMRYLTRDAKLSWKIVRGLAMKGVASDARLCRELFFDDGVQESDLAQYMEGFKEDSVVTIDLADLAKSLPTTAKQQPPKPMFVLGGESDKIVDYEGIQEMGKWARVELLFAAGCHDVMLAGN